MTSATGQEIAEEDAAPIRCRDLVFGYRRGRRIINGITFDLNRGELLCVLGPNGAGKTTLIRQIVGELQPTAGTIAIMGRSVRHARAEGLVGIVPQDAGLFQALTVTEHLRYFAAMKGVPRAGVAAEVAVIVDTCGLSPLLGRRCGELSGGQQRLLLLGLALLGNPAILVLDEPTVGLDPLSRRKVWDVIEGLKRQGRSVLLTTHYLDEAERLSTRIGFVVDGTMSRLGTLSELQGGAKGGVTMTVRTDAVRHLRFQTPRDALNFAQSGDLDDFSIQATSLEDLYVDLIGGQAALPE